MEVSLEGSDPILVRIGESGRVMRTVLAVYCAPSGGRSAFLGDHARVLPTLPSRSLVFGDLNFDLSFDKTLILQLKIFSI